MPNKPKRPDPDAAVIRSLLLLTEGDPSAFRDATAPPPEITAYIHRASAPQLHGLLIATLSAWHAIKGK